MKSYYQLIRHEGNQDLFKAVDISLAALSNEYPLHIHAQGLRGTGKTTVMRAVQEILPPIVRIRGCIYNCHPEHPHCPQHRMMSAEDIALIGTEVVPCPFLEISHAAKIGTVVGSIDLAKLVDRQAPDAALLPGIIPRAHRGIVFIDEINRLVDTSPEIADVLLDLMGTKPGRIQIEEVGLPTVDMSVSVSVWAASNPDEEPGSLENIRKQLSDRFDIVINTNRPSEYKSVISIINGFGVCHPENYSTNFKYGRLDTINVDASLQELLARIYVDFGLESLRSVEGVKMVASLIALTAGKTKIAVEDIIQAVPLVLRHRTDLSTINSILEFLRNQTILCANSTHGQSENGLAKRSLNGSSNETRKFALWDIFTQIMNKFKITSRNAKSDLSNKTSQSTLGHNHNRQHCRTKDLNTVSPGEVHNSSSSVKITDPNNVQIDAPPNRALSLTSLPTEKFVSNGDST